MCVSVKDVKVLSFDTKKSIIFRKKNSTCFLGYNKSDVDAAF